MLQIRSVGSVMSDSLRPHELQHARPPCPSPTPWVHWDSRPSSQWCHPAISSFVFPFSSCPQSLPASVFSNESTLDYICSKCIFVSSFSSFWLLSLSLLSGSCFLIQPSEAKSTVWWQVRCLLEPWSRVWSLEWAKRFQSFLFSTLTSLHPCWDLTDLKQRFLF